MRLHVLIPLVVAALSLAGAATVQVQPGDTLTRIALRAGTTPQAFLRANPGLRPNALRVGIRLKVPDSSAGNVVVRAGDTLSALGRQRGVTVDALLKANPSLNPRRALQIGQMLRLPPTTVVRAASSAPRVQQTGIRVTAVMPVQGRLTTPYRRSHEGLDLAAPTGTLIRAALSGVVMESRYDGRTGWGWTVVLNHGNGLNTRYSHNSANLVRVGARVNAGEVIARVGSTGNSTGPHVDYRVYQGERTINPAALY